MNFRVEISLRFTSISSKALIVRIESVYLSSLLAVLFIFEVISKIFSLLKLSFCKFVCKYSAYPSIIDIGFLKS